MFSGLKKISLISLFILWLIFFALILTMILAWLFPPPINLNSDLHTIIGQFFLSLSELPPRFSPAELSHLFDVRVWFRLSAVIFVILTSLIIFFRSAYSQFRVETWRYLLVVMLLGLCLMIIFVSSVGFENWWRIFHLILFPQGNWEFSSTSILIQNYPELYWQCQGLVFVLNYIFLCALTFGLVHIFKSKTP